MQPWLIKDLLPVGGSTHLYGNPKAGKGFLALGMAIAISSGAPDWLGFPVGKHGPVAYLQLDTARNLWATYLSRIQRKHYDLSRVFMCDNEMCPVFPFNALDAAHIQWLKGHLAPIQPVMVVIDTLREVHGGDENDSTIMRNVMTNIISACRPATSLFVAHPRKGTAESKMSESNLMSDARGSSYVAGKVDVVIKLTKTHMSYEGRGIGKGTVGMFKDRDKAGLHSREPEEEAYRLVIHNTVSQMRTDNPKTTINAMKNVIEKLTTFRKDRTITNDIGEYLTQMNMEDDN